jgi:hypothetical protein
MPFARGRIGMKGVTLGELGDRGSLEVDSREGDFGVRGSGSLLSGWLFVRNAVHGRKLWEVTP